MTDSAPSVELLYFDGCPTHDKTTALIEEVAAELELDVEVQQVHVRTDAEATELGFLGSPSVRVDGADIDPDAAERSDFGRRCRLYPGEDGFQGTPPRAWIEAALRGESVPKSETRRPATSSCACCAPSPEVTLVVADWCPQCPAAHHYWQELATELGFELTTVDIASDDGAALAEDHGIRAVPTAIVAGEVFAPGVTRPARDEVERVIGATDS